MLHSLFAVLGQVGLTAGVAAAAAWAFTVWFAQKHIEARIKAAADQHLAKQKHEFDRTIEGLKARVGRLQDRASKLHQREYEVLPDAWGLLNKAYGIAQEATGSQAIYLGKNGGDREAIEAIIEQCDLEDWQKARLKASPHWYSDYTEMRLDKSITNARAAIIEFRNFVILNGVLIQEPLERLMLRAAGHIADANEMRWAVVEGINEPSDPERLKEHLQQAGGLLEEIKHTTRSMLFETEYVPAQ
jgi:hypothetical protein